MSKAPDSGRRRARRRTALLVATVTVRLDQEVLVRIDAIAAARSTPWRKVTRAEVLREVIGVGLAAHQRKKPRLRLVTTNEPR